MNKMNPKELTSISILIYAGSQYSSLGEAIKNQADIHLSFNDYYETIKGLEACCKVANLLDYKSHLNDLRASMVINHTVCLEEMFLATALAYLSSWTE